MYNVSHDEFTQNLVLIMVGVKLENFKPEQQADIAGECISIYKQYVEEYFANHFPDIDIAKINSLNLGDIDNQNIALGLAQKIQQAQQSFISHLEENWAEK